MGTEMKVLYVIAVASFFAFVPSAKADPSPGIQWLMNEPATLFDWGMLSLYEHAKELETGNIGATEPFSASVFPAYLPEGHTFLGPGGRRPVEDEGQDQQQAHCQQGQGN